MNKTKKREVSYIGIVKEEFQGEKLFRYLIYRYINTKNFTYKGFKDEYYKFALASDEDKLKDVLNTHKAKIITLAEGLQVIPVEFVIRANIDVLDFLDNIIPFEELHDFVVVVNGLEVLYNLIDSSLTLIPKENNGIPCSEYKLTFYE